jgi:hypothetical protein
MPFLRPATLSLLGIVFFAASTFAVAAPTFPPEEAGKHLPATIGEFRATSPVTPFDPVSEEKFGDFNIISASTRSYRSKSGENFLAALVVTRSDSSAYSLLTNMGCVGDGVGERQALPGLENRSCLTRARAFFAKGRVYVNVDSGKGEPVSPDALKHLSQLLSELLDRSEEDIPALVKHLPNWQNFQQISYAVNPNTLKKVLNYHPVLDAISFEGGAEAVIGNYGGQRLVIVEFNTPQIATTNDQNIVAKINELKASIPSVGMPLPPAYRRVGNYAVFVFDAPNEQAANQLIDQVKYQQVVQWLGENPFSYERATREFTETTLGVFVSVVKTSGLALVACLAAGGFFGALLFRFRRAQQRAREAYSDSDAMIRLNLDDLTPESDPPRLLGRGR